MVQNERQIVKFLLLVACPLGNPFDAVGGDQLAREGLRQMLGSIKLFGNFRVYEMSILLGIFADLRDDTGAYLLGQRVAHADKRLVADGYARPMGLEVERQAGAPA